MQRVYSLLVDNNSGVLSRISGLFTRRGYNIDSITAGVTADSRFTRITIVSSGDEIKIRANAQQRSEIVSIADIFRAKIVDAERESLVIELTGTQSKLEAFLQLLDGYEILELARTGIAGLSSKNSFANVPSWISERIFFIAFFVSSVIILGPVT